MIFLLGLMIIGLAVLAGGQVWAFTGNTMLAWVAGVLLFVLLTWLVRGLSKKNKGGNRFVGEVEEHIEEGEFMTLVPGNYDQQQERLQKRVRYQSQQAAYTIRSMLRQNKDGEQPP